MNTAHPNYGLNYRLMRAALTMRNFTVSELRSLTRAGENTVYSFLSELEGANPDYLRSTPLAGKGRGRPRNEYSLTEAGIAYLIRRSSEMATRFEEEAAELPTPPDINLALPVAVQEPRLEFFAFDASYIERLRSGDAQIEGHFVNYFSELIRLKLRSRLSSKEAIEDVRQETFVRVLVLLRGQPGLKQPDRLGPFVNSVCNHVLLEHYRAEKRSKATIHDETEETITGHEASALRLLEAKDTERVVRQILDALKERDRRLLQSVLLEERDKDEVCAEFGISREYLRVLLHRAKSLRFLRSFAIEETC